MVHNIKCGGVRGTCCYWKLTPPHTLVMIQFLSKYPLYSEKAEIHHVICSSKNNSPFEKSSLCFSLLFPYCGVLGHMLGLLQLFKYAQIKEITQLFANVQGRHDGGFMPYIVRTLVALVNLVQLPHDTIQFECQF